MSGSTLRDRMRARRQQLKDTVETTDMDPSPRDTTWEAAIEEDSVERFSEHHMDEEEEDEESEELAKKLKKRHKKTQRQLDRTLQTQDEDVTEQLRTAKGRTKQRIMEETARSAGEDSDDTRSHDRSSYDRSHGLTEDDGGVPDSTPPDTARSTSGSPRRMSTTPRRATSSTLGQSYRQRLIEKKKAAKDKAKDEAYKEGSQTGRRLAGMRSIPRVTRFDDPDMSQLEDKDLEQELEKTFTRSKWKQAASKVTTPSNVPDPAEAYDFFTKQFEAEPDQQQEDGEGEEGEEDEEEEEGEAPRPEGEQDGEEATVEEAEEGQAGKKKKKKGKKEDEEPLLEDELEEAESWRHYQMGRAEYKPFRKKLEDEQKQLFYPSIREAPEQQRIFESKEPRYLEDEGFYVGVKPIVPNRNVHKMENRLIKEDSEGSKKWFGEDGRLIALPDPLKEVPSRPYIIEEIEPALQTDYFKATVHEFDSRFIDGSVDGRGRYRLDVDLNTVSFQHHHLFSREHVLAARITQQYLQYTSRNKRKAAQYLTEKLSALQAAASHVEENIATIKSNKRNKSGTADQEARLKDYREEIRQTRKLRDTELGTDRTLLKNIIQTWKDIKSLRTFQRCVNTSIKLQIRKESSNKAADEEEWEREITEELKEMKDDLQEEHNKQMEHYRQQLEKWKKQKLDKKEASKRERQRERARQQRARRRERRQQRGDDDQEDEEDEIYDDDEELEEKDRLLLAEADIEKPEKPKFEGDSEARQKVQEKFEEIRRRPGEPHLYPEVSHGMAITKISECPRGEQSRRNDVNRYKLFCKVLFNGKEVSRTHAKPLGQDFVVRFAQIFNIEIVQWPENIKIEIYESTVLSNTLVSEVYLLIPDANVTTDNISLDDMEFSSDNRESHSHEGVGSGVAFSFEASGGNHVSLMTTGMLGTSVAWAVDQQGKVLVPPTAASSNQLYNAMKGMDAVAGIGMSGMADMDKLSKWISKSRLDPNDPSNAELMHLMRPTGGGDTLSTGLRLPEHFRLEQLQEEFNFCNDNDLDTSKRFTLIKLREQEVPEFKNKIVPAFDKEVTEDTFDEYEKRLRADDKLKDMDVMESHRVAVAKFMHKVREQIMLRFRIASHQKTLKEMIDEDMMPNIGTFMPQLLKIFEPSRPLRPNRRERKKVTPQNLQGPDAVKVLVNIVRAFDIPVRSDAAQMAAGAGGAGQPPQSARGGTWQAQQAPTSKNIGGETLVRPFIEVMFQRHTVQTTVAEGPNPSWNEELQIPFKAPNSDYSPSNLETCRDVLHLNLFDEYIIDMPATDQERGTSIHRRIEKKWLGSIKVPFSTIYFNSRIDGTFRIKKPPVLLGYDSRQNRNDMGLDVGSGEHTYITLFITIEPPLTLAEPVKEKFDSNEDEKLLQVSEQWQNECEAKYPKRQYKTTVVDINGKTVFLTRYLKPLKPPAELLESSSPQSQAESIARFVALIPFVSDSVIFPGICDIWSTCDQFLQMLQGDEEEHAVLLANYFLHLGKPTWLLIGSAIPEGPTAYVVTKENNNDFWVWNASTGEHYSYKDNYCPVTSIGCLANAENIWANVQPQEQPCRMSFDLNNTNQWKPFFSRANPHLGLGSVQPDSLDYRPTDRQFVVELQEKIEQKLKEKLMEWRPKHITRWNRYCMQAFRRLLLKLEESRGAGAQHEHSAELEQVLGSYKLCGFPINMPYTEMAPLIDSVFATGVHNQESSDIEFALAVHIHPYPCNVLSVWIYVASLLRKR